MRRSLFVSIVVIAIIFVPVLINFIIIAPSPFGINVAQSNDWLGFWGNYSGALLGGIITLFGIRKTLQYERKKEEENRRLSLLPYLKIYYYPDKIANENYTHMIISNVDSEKELSHSFKGYFAIENIGLNCAVDVSFFDIYFDNELKNFSVTCDILGQREKLNINLRIEIPKKQFESVTQDTVHLYPGSSLLTIKVGYEDFIGNYYEQSIEIVFRYGITYKQEDFQSVEYILDSYLSNVSKPRYIDRRPKLVL